MDLSIPGSTTNSPLIPVFADNVQDLLGTGALQVNPSAIITVNSIDDALNDPNSGVTTLRDAINQANGDTGEDLIVFDRSLFSNAQTITLNLGELDITHNLNIIAPRDSLTGEDLVTVSGNKASRVFEIESGATVSLDGLIVADGSVMRDGGGIKNLGILTLNNSIVRNNSSLAISNSGGATLTVSNTIICDNSARGISNRDDGSTVTVSNSTISGNQGGVIFNSGTIKTGNNNTSSSATVEINNSTISNNLGGVISNGIQGGDYAESYGNSIVAVNNSTISGNTGSGGPQSIMYSSGGGAILTVNNSTISGNTGGIYSNGNDVILTVNNSTISGNTAGISIESNGYRNTLTVSNSTISGNTGISILCGGYKSTLTVSNSTISSNKGSGILNLGSTGNVICSTISDNSVSSRGPLLYANVGGIFNGGTLNVSNSTISGNTASGDGGGIYNRGTLNVSNSTISGNTAHGDGGGIYNSYSSILTLLFSTVTQNQAANNGGGVYQNDVPPFSSAIPGSISTRNTIIAANLLSTDGINPDVHGTFTSNGYNLIGNSTGSTGFGVTGDIVGTSDNPIDPRLAPLDFYGGSTQTIALLPNSPAISAGDPTVLDTDPATDQRGLPRRASDGRTDIGTFEFSTEAAGYC